MVGDEIAVELAAFATDVKGSARLRVVGTSMLPLLPPGTVVEIEPLPSKLNVGDVLVFRAGKSLLVHRVVALRGESGVQTCGDAIPENPEHVAYRDVVGRVRSVWAGDGTTSRKLRAPTHPLVAYLIARTRSVRATSRLLMHVVRLIFGRPKQVAAFRALAGAAIAFERGDPLLAIARLRSVPLRAFVAVAQQHAMGGHMYRWLEASVDAGLEVPPEYVMEFRNLRWFAALSSAQVAARTRDVAGIFAEAAIEAVFLKGAARLCAAATDADVNPVDDVDVLVPAAEADRAVAVLHAAGYYERMGRTEVRFHERRLHHRAPLWPQAGFAPVEVHVALCAPGTVSAPLDYDDLRGHVRTVAGSAGTLKVFDDVASALHLAYHGRDLHVLRDILLLSRLLRGMSVAERAAFDRLVAREGRDTIRLRSAIAAADSLAEERSIAPQFAAYLSWAIVREDLPIALRKRSFLLEAWFARAFPAYRGPSHAIRQTHRWIYNLIATPAIVAWARAQRTMHGSGSALFGSDVRVGK